MEVEARREGPFHEHHPIQYLGEAILCSVLIAGVRFFEKVLRRTFDPDPILHPGDQAGRGSLQECVKALETYHEGSSILKIADAVGGPLAFCKLPVLPWKRRFLDPKTRAIEQIQPKDLFASLMRGADSHGRTFLAIRSTTSSEIGVETLYQHNYNPYSSTWRSGHRYEKHPLAEDTLTQNTLSELNHLAKGKTTNQNKKLI